MNPCVDFCYIRRGRQYTPECDETCDYAKAIKQIEELSEVLRQVNERDRDLITRLDAMIDKTK